METSVLNADEIVALIQSTIVEWHKNSLLRPSDYVLNKESIGKELSPFTPMKDMSQIVKGLTMINTEAWHVEDQIHSGNNEIIVKAVRNANVLNQTRNKFVEGLDEFFMGCVENKKR